MSQNSNAGDARDGNKWGRPAALASSDPAADAAGKLDSTSAEGRPHAGASIAQPQSVNPAIEGVDEVTQRCMSSSLILKDLHSVGLLGVALKGNTDAATAKAV